MLFKILHGDSSRISTDITPFHEGYAYVTYEGDFYIDLNIGTVEAPNNQRVKLNAKQAESLVGYTISTTLNNSEVEIPTSKAVKAAIDSISIPTKVSELTNDAEYITADALSGLGGGDMLKATYDKDNDDVVDEAKALITPDLEDLNITDINSVKTPGCYCGAYNKDAFANLPEYSVGPDCATFILEVFEAVVNDGMSADAIFQRMTIGANYDPETDDSSFYKAIVYQRYCEGSQGEYEDWKPWNKISGSQALEIQELTELGITDLNEVITAGVYHQQLAVPVANTPSFSTGTSVDDAILEVFNLDGYVHQRWSLVSDEDPNCIFIRSGFNVEDADSYWTEWTKLATKNDIPTVPTKVSAFENDKGYLTSYTETDPTVPAWAKASSKPTYTKSEVGLGNVDNVKQYSASNPPPYPVTSVNGKTGAVALSAADLGLSGAMRFLGATTTVIFDGSSTGTVSIGGSNITAAAGNVVLYNGSEYVWDGAQWEELGSEGSFKLKQTAVTSPAASGNATAFIDTIAQDENGVVTATKKNVTFPVTSVAGKTGAVTLAKSDVGLDNVDNTSDSSKSVKYATSATIADSATKLTNARNINGTSFDGTSDITVYSSNALAPFRKSLTTNQWYRIATIKEEMGFACKLQITSSYNYTTSIGHTLLINAGYGDSNGCNITQINGATSTAVISKVRAVKKIGSEWYLEIYYAGHTGGNTVEISITDIAVCYETPESKAVTAVGFTAGEIPEGYTATEFELSTNPVKATAFEGNLVGNADSATKAVQDASGNVITTTYATKTEVTNAIASAITTALNTAV